MPPDFDAAPDDPREWLRIAREDLALARADVPGVGFGLLCFHAQQAAEKAVKAVLMHCGIVFPYVHDIGLLLQLAQKGGVIVPDGSVAVLARTRSSRRLRNLIPNQLVVFLAHVRSERYSVNRLQDG